MITYKVERFDEMKDEGIPMFEVHWNEVARNKDDLPLDPDYEKYQEMSDMGYLFIATARDEGMLIGYVFFFVINHMRYKTKKFADNDILYLDPKYRGRGIFSGLLHFAEKKLREAGVTVIHVHMKIANDFSSLLEKAGYVEMERNYERYLR